MLIYIASLDGNREERSEGLRWFEQFFTNTEYLTAIRQTPYQALLLKLITRIFKIQIDMIHELIA